jgi:hypothetical protein
MFYEFLTSNRTELIGRCRDKVARRSDPNKILAGSNYGVPVFLLQLVDILRREQLSPVPETMAEEHAPSPSEIGRTASIHGTELASLGYSIDQVVHEYGDVCQAVTELAAEGNVSISVDEFRTLNRCLDNAIADAVTSFGLVQRRSHHDQADILQETMDAFSEEHTRLVDVASQALFAIRNGAVGINGATGSLLVHALNELRTLPGRSLPGIRANETN